MLRRIFGIETEYGVTFSLRGQRRLSPDEVSRFLFRKVVAWGRSSNVFLENGCRLYLDVGSHPEYATAECDTLSDVVAQDKAGESILRELVGYAQQQLSDEGIRGDIFLFKNNTDSSGNSYGCHENYCIERIEDLTRLEQVFIPFLISRQIFTGAGKVVTNARGTSFSMSQRAEHIWESISSATTRSRPIINTRDEPHADPEKYRRLHVIVGDSNMSEFATYLKIGTAAVVLAMIEDKTTVLRDYSMSSPINALRDISYDLWSKEPVKLTNGRDLTALEIQEDLCERAENFLQSHQLPGDQVHAVKLWRQVIEQYRSDPMGLADRVDWITKLQIIERERERSGVELSDPKIALIDLLYHDTNYERGLFYRRQAKGHVRRVVTDDEIATATHTPPATTRAHMRGTFIQAAKKWRRDYTVDWVHLKLNDEMQRTVLLKDPFKSSDERFQKLLLSLERHN
ncbi:MAG TPA: Pup--protein ligase [Acidimicrobiales bacterium]|nr:MAG: Pup--protein ligase [Actinobacteria bacterium 21-64-8]HQT99988.1 Pup--protein ligase [Acidimicrobiales bacterium]